MAKIVKNAYNHIKWNKIAYTVNSGSIYIVQFSDLCVDTSLECV